MKIIINLDHSVSKDEAIDIASYFEEQPWCFKAELKDSCENCGACNKK